MAEPRRAGGARGFSLVELLVALVFTMTLMAGMANVYRASMSSFYTSGESISSTRRNRMSLDVLVDDLNQACMYLTNLYGSPSTSETWPPFLVLPNSLVVSAGSEDPQTTDELYFYLDQALPFEATLSSTTTQKSSAELLGLPPTPSDSTFTLNCAGSATYAGQVQSGQWLIFKDAWDAVPITVDSRNGATVTVHVAATDPSSARVTGYGNPGDPLGGKHLIGSNALFAQAAQMVRYHIEMLDLDPGATPGIPCLVRDQGNYSTTGFAATQPQQILAENVAGFKVYLSADGGTNWAGLGSTTSGFDAGWNGSSGMRSGLDAQLVASSRSGFTTTRGIPDWFRSIPILVRLDVTTRTATQRSEYAAAGRALAYRTFTQSLIVVPRHSGLATN